ncbi:MAG: carboxypeptidase-like regulatory domain-containing protein, partial [Paludibacteraceae bacterium]
MLNIIEYKTGYSYLVRDNDIDLGEILSIRANDKTLKEVLSLLFDKRDVNYEIRGRNISIFNPKTEPDIDIALRPLIALMNGKIVDAIGLPIANANILIKGTHYGSVSDTNGAFKIEAPYGTTLIISHIGYSTVHIKISEQENVTIRLTEVTNPIDELVVVGFGVQSEQDMTSSVAKVHSNIIKDKSSVNIMASLQGEISGINISQFSGKPGVMPNMMVRGSSSLLNSNKILTIIDGIPGSLSLLNPNEIESISILKDAASGSVYGARAANGVVLVTTKHGRAGELSVDYSGFVGGQRPTKIFQEADAYSYANAYNAALMYDAISSANTDFDKSKEVFSQKQLDDWKTGKIASTNWRKTLFSQKSGLLHSHSINIAGGIVGEETLLKNHFSINYFKQNGNVANTAYTRFGLRENGQLEWNKFTAAFIVGLSFANSEEPNSSIGNLDKIINAVNRQRPTDPIKVYDDWSILGSKDTRNPVRQALEGGKSEDDFYNVLANV